jgi:hypothetical protein
MKFLVLFLMMALTQPTWASTNTDLDNFLGNYNGQCSLKVLLHTQDNFIDNIQKFETPAQVTKAEATFCQYNKSSDSSSCGPEEAKMTYQGRPPSPWKNSCSNAERPSRKR